MKEPLNAEETAKYFEDLFEDYTESYILEISILLHNDYFDELIQDEEKGEFVDSLVEAIREREVKRIQRIIDKVLGENKMLVIEGDYK